MKYSPRIYAEAFEKARENAAPGRISLLAKRFIGIVRKNGDVKYFTKILEQIEKMAVKKKGGRWITVEHARKHRENTKGSVEKLFSSRDRVCTVINPALIAGARITMDEEREIDYSLQRKLKKMFR